jgi:hypothetical protein
LHFSAYQRCVAETVQHLGNRCSWPGKEKVPTTSDTALKRDFWRGYGRKGDLGIHGILGTRLPLRPEEKTTSKRSDTVAAGRIMYEVSHTPTHPENKNRALNV